MSIDIANQLFLVYLGRPADVAWRNSTASLLNGAQPSVALQNAFYSAAVIDGSYSLTDSSSTLVNKIFLNLGLNNGAGATTFEQNAWAQYINSGAITAATAAWTIFTSYLGATNVPDSYKIPAQSKLIALDAYTTALGANATANLAVSQLGSSAAGSSRAVISSVLTQANAAATVTGITATVGQVAIPQSTAFTLTTGADTLTGTAGPDIFYATTNTFNATDTINGGAGIDTLEVTALAGGALAAASLSNVEILNVRTGGFNPTVDASLFPGLTQVNSVQGTGLLAVTNLAAGAAIGIVGNGSTVNGNVTYSYATATSANTINVSGGTQAGTTLANTAGAGSNPSTVTINSTGAANALGAINLTQTGASVTSLTINATTGFTGALTQANFGAAAALTVTGAGAVNTGAAVPTFKTVDASGNSGGLTISLAPGTITSFKGSTANDTVSVAGPVTATTTAGAIDAGAGTGDVLSFTGPALVVTNTQQGAVYANFETLRLGYTAALNQDMSFLSGITALQISAAGGNLGINKATAAQAASVSITGLTSASSVTLTLLDPAGASDVASITYDKAVVAHAGGLVLNGFETVNLTDGAATTIGNVTSADTTALNLKGVAYTFTSLAGVAKGVNIDASALTGDAAGNGLTIGTVGNAATGLVGSGATITATAFKDVVQLGTGFNTYSLGAGDDSVTATQAQLRTGLNSNIIDGGVGKDTLNLTLTAPGAAGPSVMNDSDFRYITGFEVVNFTAGGAPSNGITFVSGGYFDANFKSGGAVLAFNPNAAAGTVTVDLTNFTGASTVTNTSTTGAITITGGSGNDTVTTTGTVASVATVSTGAGDDKITVTSAAAAIITGGKGQDTIDLTNAAGADTINFAFGDSSSSTFDTITGFALANTDKLNFTSTLTGGITTIAASVVGAAGKAATSAAGLATFNAADTTFAQHLAAVQAAVDAGGLAAGKGAVWQEGADAYLFVSDGVAGLGPNDLVILLSNKTVLTGLTAATTTFTLA